ncbi:MAG: molybdopterin-guanine dinucleotide biosynthesis protein B [Candidatus Heimdallarchaeota archaeon]|nr:molybdopterin-guanine dinucleotide biosynthesis protein B [Candidatus Heimdallarchaeota archaeon]
MKIFTVIGYTNSGKTTTLVEIIKELVTLGKKVNTIKAIHIDEFTIDTEGKDSWLHKQAGATSVGIRSGIETTIMYQKKMTVKEMIPFFKGDYLILEGFTNEKFIPKILCAKSIDEIDHRFDDTVFALSGVISNEYNEFKNVQVVNALSEIKKLINLIEKHAIDVNNLL